MPATDNRRGFLGWCTGLLLAVLGLLVAVPALGYVCAPLRRRRQEDAGGAGFVDIGPVADLPVGEWSLRTVTLTQEDAWTKRGQVRRAVWVRRQADGDGTMTVLSPLCPHLGCPINWHPDRAQFQCPCHGGVFASDGKSVSGPPPRSMDPLAFEVRAGRLWVRWQDFKIGVADRVPVST
jgi:menaquinol-cytochrome c reductase iron-sulfur subunit